MENSEKFDAREYYDIHPCPNPPHEFRIGKLIGEWQIAQDHWSFLLGDDSDPKSSCMDCWFHVGRHKRLQITLYNVIIYKLKITIGFV